MTFEPAQVDELLDQLEFDVSTLRAAVRGSDSALVSLKVDTIAGALSLLRVYVAEAAEVDDELDELEP